MDYYFTVSSTVVLVCTLKDQWERCSYSMLELRVLRADGKLVTENIQARSVFNAAVKKIPLIMMGWINEN